MSIEPRKPVAARPTPGVAPLLPNLAGGASGASAAVLFIETAQHELVHLMRLIAEGDSAAATRVAWCMVERGRTVLAPQRLPAARVAPPTSDGAAGYSLSRRELDVLRMISQGLSNRQIAEATHRSLHTVDAHVKNIYRKLAVKSRARAVREAKQKGLIDLEACE